SGAEDAGLLAPDLFARRAQIFDMVDADARQHRAVGIDDVDRVEPAAQPDLEDRRLDLRSRKKPERRWRAEFEIRELDIPSRLLYCRERFGQSLVRSLDARYAHALVVAQQVRRRVEAGSVARGAQDRLEHRAGRAFAVGAADSNNGAVKTHSHSGHDLRNPVEPERDRLRMLALDVREPFRQRSHCDCASKILRTVWMVSTSSGRVSGRW